MFRCMRWEKQFQLNKRTLYYYLKFLPLGTEWIITRQIGSRKISIKERGFSLFARHRPRRVHGLRQTKNTLSYSYFSMERTFCEYVVFTPVHSFCKVIDRYWVTSIVCQMTDYLHGKAESLNYLSDHIVSGFDGVLAREISIVIEQGAQVDPNATCWISE